MPNTKNAMIRYQALDKCFRNTGRKYDMEALVNACNEALYNFSGIEEGIKKRQVYNDIKYMESEEGWSIELKKSIENRRTYYRYSNTDFSINNQPLSELEANQLKEALLLLSRFKGMPQFEWIEEMTLRMESVFGKSSKATNIIAFEQNPYLKGLDFISPIFNAIQYQQCINISYKSFNRTESIDYSLHPHFLKQYRNRWYVLGKTEGYENISIFALDRIEIVKNSIIPYKATDSNYEEYFEDIIGVSFIPGAKVVQIKLFAQANVLPYIKTKPLHGSQRIYEEDENGAFIRLDVIPNYELESTILSYGEKLIVIEPKSLKEKIYQRLSVLMEKYF